MVYQNATDEVASVAAARCTVRTAFGMLEPQLSHGRALGSKTIAPRQTARHDVHKELRLLLKLTSAALPGSQTDEGIRRRCMTLQGVRRVVREFAISVAVLAEVKFRALLAIVPCTFERHLASVTQSVRGRVKDVVQEHHCRMLRASDLVELVRLILAVQQQVFSVIEIPNTERFANKFSKPQSLTIVEAGQQALVQRTG